jgi:hypothetical protein
VATTGTRAAMAPITDRGTPSRRDASTSASLACNNDATSSRLPRKRTAAPAPACAARRGAAPQHRLVRPGAHLQQLEVRHRPSGDRERVDQVALALELLEARDAAHDRRVVADADPAPDHGSVLPAACGRGRCECRCR